MRDAHCQHTIMTHIVLENTNRIIALAYTYNTPINNERGHILDYNSSCICHIRRTEG